MPCAGPYLPNHITFTVPAALQRSWGPEYLHKVQYFLSHGWRLTNALILQPDPIYGPDWLISYARVPFDCQEQQFGKDVDRMLMDIFLRKHVFV
ncbi:hypothetical protein TWF730_006103 [Orbilia blumenaviensis]|uniref:Uncharacterized protein n=1 Tax=Orbilia blumenaviensis TaxID=1796055 RepID=A0AAV9TWG5_9PEZI